MAPEAKKQKWETEVFKKKSGASLRLENARVQNLQGCEWGGGMDILVGGQPHRPRVLPEDAREDKHKEHRQTRGTRGRARCLSGDGLRGIGAYFSIRVRLTLPIILGGDGTRTPSG